MLTSKKAKLEFVNPCPLSEFPLWEKIKNKRNLISFDLELTARCNNNCRHCYINLPAQDKEARKNELSLRAIKGIIDESVSLGALWCLLTGGEPLLREDFFDIYLHLKKKGLLVSVFTNATLITNEHVRLFKNYPPRNIEIAVYGVTGKTYEAVTRTRGSFKAFKHGLNLLLKNGIKPRFKAMALRSNVHELYRIAAFCRERTKDYFRFDPFLHLGFDGNKIRNEEIKSERLLPKEIVAIEQADPERSQALKEDCDKLIVTSALHIDCNYLFHCGAGNNSFSISYDGFFCLCSSLRHPDCIYNLKKGGIIDAWQNFVPQVRSMRSNREDFLKKCCACPLVNLCMWCPAHSYLEVGEMDMPNDYFCEVAHARADVLTKGKKVK